MPISCVRLRDRVSHDAVNADRGKEQRRDREDGTA